MKNEQPVRFTDDGQAMFDRIAAIWPPLIRAGRAGKIEAMLGLLMRDRTIGRADADLVVEAARLVVPGSYDPLFDLFRDPAGFRKKMLDPFVDEQAYAAMPVRVRRWKRVRRRARRPNDQPPMVLGFCASPRARGNTDLLVSEALRGAKDSGARTEKIMLQKIRMEHCIGCRKCKDPGFEPICVIRDDMPAVYDKIIRADSLIIGFPIYTGRECAQLATFFDRWDGYERHLLTSCLQPGRTAMVIGTWGYPAVDTYDHVIENIVSILNLHKVETIEALSACGFEGLRHGLDEKLKGVIAQHPAQLRKAYAAGRALAGTGRADR